jgi:hypothetical protein
LLCANHPCRDPPGSRYPSLTVAQIGTPDCDKGSIDLKVGEKIHCDVVDPKAPTAVCDSVLTITKVSGLKYSTDIKVANTPKT